MSGISFATALDALFDCFDAASPSDVTVFDGDPPQSPPRKFLCVGWGPGDPGVTGQLTRAGARRTDEESEISCLLSYWDGSKAAALRQVRAAAVALFNVFDAALAADRTLSGAGMQAKASAYEYAPDTNREGALVQLRWTVSFNALSV